MFACIIVEDEPSDVEDAREQMNRKMKQLDERVEQEGRADPVGVVLGNLRDK